MRSAVLLILSVLALASETLGQAQRGKIRGAVTDARTREPLVGVNVLIEGTRLGGATDAEGEYFILSVPPGRYTLIASMMGYNRLAQTGVEVFIDRTTELNFRLSDATIDLQEVTVVAEKPKVVKDLTATSQTLDNAQIGAAAIEGLRGALDLQASFQRNAQGSYSVRGSGSYEVNFQINGVEQINSLTTAPGSFGTDKANNSWKYDVNPLGVQQVQMISGGFSAEYGNAQAGVVKVVTKEGSQRLTGEIRVEMRPPGQYHFGPYVYDQSNYEWQKWGPLENWYAQRDLMIGELKLDQRYADLIAAGDSGSLALYNQIVDREIDWAHGVWVKNHTPADDNPLGIYDYRNSIYQRYLVGIGGPLGANSDLLRFHFSGEYRVNPTRLPTAEKLQVYQNYVLNLTYRPAGAHTFRLMGMFQKYRGGIWSGSEDIRYAGLAFSPPGVSTKYYILVDPVRLEQTVTQSLTWLFAIDDRSFLETSVAHMTEKYELPYEYLVGTTTERDRLDSLNDPRGTILKDGVWWDTQYYRPPFNVSTNYYQDTRTNHWSGSVNYTNQVTPGHQLKAGLRLLYWDMVNNGVNSSFQANTYVARSGYAEYYRAFPFLASAYAQDRMEFSGMIANLGLRAEFYNFQNGMPADQYDPFYQGTGGPGELGNPATVGSATKTILLPRVGVSFPIGEETAFRLQYGHFASMPQFNHGLSQRTQSGWIGRQNSNLEPKKTINYEFGVQQALEDHRLDLALYYNDRARQVGTLQVAAFTGSRDRFVGFTTDNVPLYAYTTFSNNAFGSTLGLELTFERVGRARWGYRVAYNVSQTTEGRYGAPRIYPDEREQYTTRLNTGEYISLNDRTHVLRALVQHSLGDEEGPEVFGGRIFANTTVSLTYTAQSGTPIQQVSTNTFSSDALVNRRYPLETNFDLNATKTIMTAGMKILLGLRVMNLFNNRWLTPLETDEDRAAWANYGITVEDPEPDPLRLSHVVGAHRAYRNPSRQVFLTLGVGF